MVSKTKFRSGPKGLVVVGLWGLTEVLHLNYASSRQSRPKLHGSRPKLHPADRSNANFIAMSGMVAGLSAEHRVAGCGKAATRMRRVLFVDPPHPQLAVEAPGCRTLGADRGRLWWIVQGEDDRPTCDQVHHGGEVVRSQRELLLVIVVAGACFCWRTLHMVSSFSDERQLRSPPRSALIH